MEEKRLAIIKTHFDEVFIELGVGDLVIFHCNTLHGSDDNTSDMSRLALLGCYNTKHNDPYVTTDYGHPFFHEQSILAEKVTRADLSNMPDFNFVVQPKS